jgi:uncharacterized protein (DUF3820 family)
MEIKRPSFDEAKACLIPFGMHKGKTIDDVPLTYLDWLRGRSLTAYLGACIDVYLEDPAIKLELEKELEG